MKWAQGGLDFDFRMTTEYIHTEPFKLFTL